MNLNTTIKELADLEIISNVLCNVCKYTGVETIGDLLNFHRKNGSFRFFLSRSMMFQQLVCLYSRFKVLETETSETSTCEIVDYSPVGIKDLPPTYHLSVSIDELYALGVISSRTYSGCVSSSLFTLSDIVCYKQAKGTFDSLDKLGKKSIFELEKIIEECGDLSSPEEVKPFLVKQGLNIARGFNDKFLSELGLLLTSEVEHATNAVKKYLLDSFPTAERFYAEMYANKDILKYVDGFSFDENLELFKIYERIAREILLWFSKNMVIKATYMDCFVVIQNKIRLGLPTIISEKRNYALLEQFNSFSKEKKEYIDSKFKAFCLANLSTRARTAIQLYFSNIQTVIRWFNGSKDEFVIEYAQTKHNVTYEELFDCIQEFKIRYWDLATYTEQQIVSRRFADAFPFLLSYQRDFVSAFLKDKGHLPLFFILSQFFKKSEDKNMQQYSMFYGLLEDRCWSIEEISKKFNCSKESVRHILRGKAVLKKCQIKTHFDWSIYDFSNINVVSENSSIYKIIKEEEGLKCGFNSFVALLRLTFPYDIIQINESYFAVREDVLNLCELTRFAKDVQKALQNKTTTLTFVSVLDYVQTWNSIDEQVRRIILSSASIVVLESLNVQMDNDGIVTIHPQKIDKENAIVKILEAVNTPLPLDDLLELLEKEYPDEKWTSDRVRFWVAKSSVIASLGKSKIYALKKWDGVFFGNIREFLVDALEKSEVPMHIDSLFEKVVKQFPDTNVRSLSSTMNNDQYHRFSAFENGYFGLSNRQYDDVYIPVAPEQRISFEKRLQMFYDFVMTYKRFPTSNSGELEESLCRWYTNVNKERVQLSENQKQAFDDLMEECSRNKYPQTGYEVAFLENCNRVKEIIMSNHRLPTRKEEPEVFNWLYKYKEKYEIYDDQRKDYFYDLLKFIQSYGFIL